MTLWIGMSSFVHYLITQRKHQPGEHYKGFLRSSQLLPLSLLAVDVISSFYYSMLHFACGFGFFYHVVDWYL